MVVPLLVPASQRRESARRVLSAPVTAQIQLSYLPPGGAVPRFLGRSVKGDILLISARPLDG